MVNKKGKDTFQCFVCNDKSISLGEYEMYKHKTLGVTICDTCKDQHMSDNKWHDSNEWGERDDKGKCIYCEICGEGGTLLPCDKCEFSFCTNKCLKIWLGDKKLEELLEDEKMPFECFRCLAKSKPNKLNSIFPNYQKFLSTTEKQMGSTGKKKGKKRDYSSDEEDEMSSEERPVERSTSKSRGRKQKEPTKQYTCYSCFSKHQMKPSKMPRMHIKTKFEICICDTCYEYMDSDDWTFTDGKSDYCVISGEGGEIFSCDTDGCSHSFCAEIMEKYLGKVLYKKIADDDEAEFFCWVCKPTLGNYPKYVKASKETLAAFDEVSEEEEPPKKAAKVPATLTNGHSKKRGSKAESKAAEAAVESSTSITKPKEKQSTYRMPDSDSESSSDEEIVRAPADSEKEAKEYYRKLLVNSPVKKHAASGIYKELMGSLE